MENIILRLRDDLAQVREEWERHRKQIEEDLVETKCKIDIQSVTLNRILAIAERDKVAETELRHQIKNEVEQELAAQAEREREEKKAADQAEAEAESLKRETEFFRELMHTSRSKPYVREAKVNHLSDKCSDGYLRWWSVDPGEGAHIYYYYITIKGLLQILDEQEATTIYRTNLDRDDKYYTEWAAKARKRGDKESLASALYNLGFIDRERGDFAAAQRSWSESGALWENVPNAQGIVVEIRGLLISLPKQ